MAPTITQLLPVAQNDTSTATNQTNTTTNNGVSYDQASSVFSGRVLSLGGVILFFLGLCCIFAVLFRFNRHRGHRSTVQVVEPKKPGVLNQDTINHNFPIRIWPCQDQIIVDKNDQVVGFFAGFKKREPSDQPKNEDMIEVGEENSDLKEEERPKMKPLLKGFGFMERLCHRNTMQSTTSQAYDENASGSSSVTETDIPLGVVDTKPLPECPSEENKGSDINPKKEPDEEEVCCSICISEYIENDRVRILSCNHEYHAECIDIWLSNKSTQCPLCKHDLLDDIDIIS